MAWLVQSLAESVPQGDHRSSFLRWVDFPLCGVLVANYLLSRYLDPHGGIEQRSILRRFFTITVLDNGPLVGLTMVRYIPDLRVLLDPATAGSALFLFLCTCKVADVVRVVLAYVCDQVCLHTLARWLGPRDYGVYQQGRQ